MLRALRKGNVSSRVVVAHDGVEALDYLFGTGDHAGRSGERDLPRVVFLDLKLPKLDGLDVLRRLRADERTRLLPVVMLTSSKQERDVVASYATGANSYVQKPIDFEAFVETTRRLGLYWLATNVSAPARRPPGGADE